MAVLDIRIPLHLGEEALLPKLELIDQDLITQFYRWSPGNLLLDYVNRWTWSTTTTDNALMLRVDTRVLLLLIA